MIPIIASISFALGGDGRFPYLFIKGANAKLWRWLMGIPISLIGLVFGHGLYSLLCILTYYIATNIPYGEKSFLNFLGAYGKFAVCGAIFGLAGFPIIGYWAILQAVLSAVGWCAIKYFDDKGQIVNPYTELARGLVGCLLMFK